MAKKPAKKGQRVRKGILTRVGDKQFVSGRKRPRLTGENGDGPTAGITEKNEALPVRAVKGAPPTAGTTPGSTSATVDVSGATISVTAGGTARVKTTRKRRSAKKLVIRD